MNKGKLQTLNLSMSKVQTTKNAYVKVKSFGLMYF